MQTIDQALEKLNRSSFRSRFKLSREDIEYIDKKGMDTIERHARDFIRDRLAPKNIPNDGKQTPMKGHPVFFFFFFCACCCRGCLNKWYRVPMNTQLTQVQQDKIVRLLMEWIRRQEDKY